MNLIEALKNWVVTSSKQKKWVAGLCVVGVVATILLFSLTNSTSPASNPMETDSFYFVGVAAKLMGVLLLIVGGAVVLRRWQGSRLGGGSTRQMRLVETIRLNPKQALHLVQVGDQRLLIGATDQAISLLTTVEMDLDTATDTIENSGQGIDFSTLFGKSLQRDQKAEKMDDPLTPYAQSEDVPVNQKETNG
jgi:flagellar biosynthetic protein FliO